MFDYVGNVGALTPQRGREKLEQRQLSRPSKTDSMIPPTKTHLPHSFNIISAKTYPAMFDYVGNVGALTPQRGREKLEQRQLSRPSKTDSLIPPTKNHLPHSFNIISAKADPAMFDYVGNVGALTPQRGREKLEQRQLSRPSKTDLT